MESYGRYHRSSNMKKFERLRHIRYFATSLANLPKQYSSADTNRLTLVHFAVQSLDILGVLPDPNVCGDAETEVYLNREEIIEWIYGLQTLPTKSREDEGNSSSQCVGGGFKGSDYLGPCNEDVSNPYDHSHLAMTYVALCTLIALGDDLSRINQIAILDTLKGLQKDDGSFVAVSFNNTNDAEIDSDDDCDLRFMYTAVSIWYILADDSPMSKINQSPEKTSSVWIDIHAATKYILSCITYEGSLGLTPGREGHGGSTFCGVASLYLMGVLDEVIQSPDRLGWKDDLIRWCVMRQYSLPNENDNFLNNGYDEGDNAAGMQGRPNKLEDTCYSYWIGGTLHLLGAAHLLEGWALREYVLRCQTPYGGFGKLVGAMPDLLHSFYSMTWLAISEEDGCCNNYIENEESSLKLECDLQGRVADSIQQLSKVDCALGVCVKRKDALSKAVNSLPI